MRPQELNLLVIFDTIMTEKSITRAAERLSMTQPAVSNAVARMRANWKDDLFVKDGRNIQPTSYAINLWEQIRTPLRITQKCFESNMCEDRIRLFMGVLALITKSTSASSSTFSVLTMV